MIYLTILDVFPESKFLLFLIFIPCIHNRLRRFKGPAKTSAFGAVFWWLIYFILIFRFRLIMRHGILFTDLSADPADLGLWILDWISSNNLEDFF